MLELGIIPLDGARHWAGGRYYLHHLVRCVAALPVGERLAVHDIYWNALWDTDPFAEVRALMTSRRVVAFPAKRVGRIRRNVTRALRGIHDARDLFAGIDVTFPMS